MTTLITRQYNGDYIAIWTGTPGDGNAMVGFGTDPVDAAKNMDCIPLGSHTDLASVLAHLHSEGSLTNEDREELAEQDWETLCEAMLSSVEETADKASGEWTDASWTHDRVEDGEVVWTDDEPEICDESPGCDTCAAATEDAAAAEEAAESCLTAMRAGNLQEAVSYAEECYRLESQWGDAPTWRPLRDLLRKIEKVA